MRYQVPQFVEVEDKIFWSLTLKQFIYLAGGAGICVILYLAVKPFLLALLLILPVAAFSLALAFFKYNERPFIFMVEAATKYLFNSKLYIWRKDQSTNATPATPVDDLSNLGGINPLSNSKLKDMTYSLDMKKPESTEK